MLKVYYDNRIKEAEVDVSEQDPKHGLEFLYNDNQGTPFLTISISENYTRFRFPSSTQIKAAIPLNHNFITGDALLFEGSNDNFDTPPAGSVPIDPILSVVEVDWQYLDYQLRFQKLSGTFEQIGEVFLAKSLYELESSYNWGYSKIKRVIRKKQKAKGGNVYREKVSVEYGWKFNFTEMPDTQQQAFEEILESDYMCIMLENKVYYGYMEIDEFIHVGTNDWKCNMEFWEKPK